MSEADSPTLRVKHRPSAGPERLVLVVLTGPQAGREFVLSRASSILGRGPGASLVLRDPQVSRRHVKLVLLPDPAQPSRRVALLQDLQSTNGVRVDGRKVSRRLLHGGERIAVGHSALRFERRDSLDLAFHARLQALATTDDLTGVGNRLALGQELERLEALRSRYGRPFSLLVVDLDHFHKVNARLGHAAGDQVLLDVVAVTLSNLRDPDRVFRYGGEEFVSTLPETDLKGAAALAERIRACVQATSLRLKSGTFRITVSVGVAEAGSGDVLRRADRALYLAKRGGRNRVQLAFQRARQR